MQSQLRCTSQGGEITTLRERAKYTVGTNLHQNENNVLNTIQNALRNVPSVGPKPSSSESRLVDEGRYRFHMIP